ncbi:MAG: gliding motility protein GldN [Bacteroidota bacterium]|nr:gliding motility protein GldN [Bacteroidota bacterium]MDX5430214.1 gliding motility protein GldN [Bacteroidota bacterium]MDX5468976.1 gliding motility protein GldN [Bacteroidota bacterium]
MKGLRIASLFALVALGAAAYAQPDYDATIYEDWTYEKAAVKQRKVVPYPYLREADVAYSKRIWRVVDTRQKQNLVMKWPKSHFGNMIYKAVNDGILTPYRSDSIVSIYTPEEVLDLGVYRENQQIINPENPDDPYDLIDTVITTPFDPLKIEKFYIMEDWIFDKKHSLFFARIIAIAPAYRPIAGGIELPEQPLFWIYYPELRNVMNNWELFNRKNDASRISYDHWFEKRMFASYIYKESNEYDYRLKDFAEFEDNGLALLLKAEEIQNELFITEHDLWEY